MDPERFARRRAKREARRNHSCQRSPEQGIVIGALIIMAGMVALFANIGIVFVRDLWSCWPIFLIAVGIAKGLKSSRPSVLISACVISAAGALLLLRNLDVLTFNFNLIWPMIVIGFGLAGLAEWSGRSREMASK